MPSLPDVPKAMRLAVTQTLADSIPATNRYFLQWTGLDPTPADLGTFLTTVAANYVTHVFAELSNQVTGGSVEGTVLTSPTSPSAVEPMTGTGASVTKSVPAGTAMVMQEEIARRYRGGKPRVYIAGIPDDQLVDLNTWTNVAGNAVQAGLTAWMNSILSAGWSSAGTLSHVNISYFSGFTNHTYPSGRVKAIPTPRPTPLVDLITNFSFNPQVASQRRRNKQSG